MSGPTAKLAFDQLALQKEAITAELGLPLEWQRLDTKIACRIIVFHDGSIQDPQQREEIKEWMWKTAEKFRAVFAPKVAALQLETDDEG
jgi:hypothetical protein